MNDLPTPERVDGGITVRRADARAPETRDSLARLCVRTFNRDLYAELMPGVLDDARHVLFTATSAHSTSEKVGFLGAAVMSSSADGRAAYLDLIAVDPDCRQRGIAAALLRRIERAAIDLGATTLRVSGHPPHYLWPGVDLAYLAAVCLFERAGYVRGSTVVNLWIDLSEAGRGGASSLESGVELLNSDAIDAEWLDAEVRRSWKVTWAEELLTALRRAQAGEPAGVVIAVAGGDCVGFCAWGANRPHEIGPAGTREDWRRRGIGEALLHRCLSEQVAAGLTTAELQWAGPLAWFSRHFGATFSRAFLMYSKDLR